MTARELYDTDPTFRHLIDAFWVKDRRRPFVLEDYLRERDMHSQADCAKWAAEEEDRPVYRPVAGVEEGGSCGPFPTADDSDSPTWFWGDGSYPTKRSAHHVPNDRMDWDGQGNIDEGWEVPEDAILGLMDAWVSEPAGVEGARNAGC